MIVLLVASVAMLAGTLCLKPGSINYYSETRGHFALDRWAGLEIDFAWARQYQRDFGFGYWPHSGFVGFLIDGGQSKFLGYEIALRIAISFWLMGVTIGGSILGLLIDRRRRLALRPPWICKQCGYDIRATPDRCPECGLAMSQPA